MTRKNKPNLCLIKINILMLRKKNLINMYDKFKKPLKIIFPGSQKRKKIVSNTKKKS